jgi:hypothetical protein
VAVPEPKRGLVIRYDYLWLREASAGRDQSKDRPACLVAARDSSSQPRYVIILPITHSARQAIPSGSRSRPKCGERSGWRTNRVGSSSPSTMSMSGRMPASSAYRAGLGFSPMGSFPHAYSPGSSASFSIWPAGTATPGFDADRSMVITLMPACRRRWSWSPGSTRGCARGARRSSDREARGAAL